MQDQLTVCRKRMLVLALLLITFSSLDICGASQQVNEEGPKQYDLIVFAATPAGIAAALAAKSLHRPSLVLLIEPTTHVGGMATAGGIGFRDCELEEVRRSTSTQYQWGMRNAKYYGLESPVWQPDNWLGELNFLKMIYEADVELMLNKTFVEGEKGVLVDKINKRIVAIKLESGEELQAKYFIDASYEGELMMASGVSYTFGREPKDKYTESYGGITISSVGQFKYDIDPYGPDGKLLKWIQDGPDSRSFVGEGDENLMAYSFRACLTTNASNMVPFSKPDGYDPFDFELHRRYLRAQLDHGDHGDNFSLPWQHLPYHNYPQNKSLKKDACCGNSPVGIDAVGLAVGYPNGTRAKRKEIYDIHKYYVQGLMWFWANDPDVPEMIREEIRSYGLCKDEWPDNDHFPPQLYVREAVRMVGDKVFAQNDRRDGNKTWAIANNTLPWESLNSTKEEIPSPDVIDSNADSRSRDEDICRNSVAVGSWGFDIHEMERIAVTDKETGKPMAYNEGLTSYDNGGIELFDIPYYVLLPSKMEIVNLAVPNCPSVSHVMFAAIREEPTLWQLGEAAGTAVGLAVKSGGDKALQDVRPLDVSEALVDELLTYSHWPPTVPLDCILGGD